MVLSTAAGMTASNPMTFPTPADANAITGPLTKRRQPSRRDNPDRISTPTVQIATSQPTLCTNRTPTLSDPNNDSISGIGM